MATSPLDAHVDQIRIWLYEYKTNEQIVKALKRLGVETTEASVRRLIDRHYDLLGEAAEIRTARNNLEQEAEAPGYSATDDDEFTVTEPLKELGADEAFEDVSRLTIQRVMARHQLDPEVWECATAMPNVWQGQRKGGEVVNFYQFKLHFKKKVAVKTIYPGKIGQSTFSTPRVPDPTRPILTVIPTDPQAPYINAELHELFLRWLRWNKPGRGVVGGDIMDNGSISRHRDDPAWDASVQGCIDSATRMLEEYRNASEDTQWTLIKGNHDDRIRNEQLERAERLYGIRPGILDDEEPQEQVFSLNNLLRLKDLGIEYHEPLGTYEFEQIPITELIAVRHGHRASASKTKPGLVTALELGHSVVLGHTHRQSIHKQTRWNSLTGEWNVITGIEAGAMCLNEGGLGYANGGAPDWQPGFATVTYWPDGGFTADLATFEQGGILRWRDQVYSL